MKSLLLFLTISIIGLCHETLCTEKKSEPFSLNDFTLLGPFKKELSLYLDKSENKKIIQTVNDGLRDFNITKTGDYFYQHCTIFITNTNGDIVAGAVSDIQQSPKIGDVCLLHALWVHQDYRRQGLGAIIIQKLQQHAHSKNCNIIQVRVGEYQYNAKKFFEACGFTTTTVIPAAITMPGFELYIMRKNFDNYNTLSINSSMVTTMNQQLTISLQETADEKSTEIKNKFEDCNAVSAGIKNIDHYSLFATSINDNIIAGAISFITTLDHVALCVVDRLWVDAAWRGQSIGSAIMQNIIDNAQKNNCHFVELETYEWQAKEFYEKQGFTLIGTIANLGGYSGGEYYFMRKLLQ